MSMILVECEEVGYKNIDYIYSSILLLKFMMFLIYQFQSVKACDVWV